MRTGQTYAHQGATTALTSSQAFANPDHICTLAFVLIGDSSEQDPEIYREAVREFPGRIAATYIRTVSAGGARYASVERLADEVRAAGSELILVTDSEAVAVHEIRAGRIAHDRLQHVRLDEKAEKRLPAPAVEDVQHPGEKGI